jgi:protein tyrosine phosphatase (PTP) superfamily phosphohydrolase (DUF442 family)
VRRVINLGLHSHEHALADEAASLRALGIDYVHIPVPFDAPTAQHYDQFASALMAAGDEPVHVHCILNARVSAFFYRYRIAAMGMDATVARAAMETVWRPGGVWAAFIGDDTAHDQPHQFAGKDY